MPLHVRMPVRADNASLAVALPDRAHHLLEEAAKQHLHGDLSVAEGLYLAILDAQPEAADALFLLGTLYLQSGAWNQAIARFGRLITLHPRHVDGYFHMGVACQENGAVPEAVQCYQAALAIDNQHIGALLALAALLVEQQRYAEAEVHYLRVCALEPRLAEAEYGLGNLRFWQCRYADAAAHFTRAAQYQPNHPGILCSLGATLRKQSYLEAAETCLRQALALDPSHADAHFNLGIVLLQQGRLEEGWHEYEWRFRIRGRAPVVHTQPVWDGSSLAGKTILIQAEQGFGDTFQFLRYLPLLKARGARVLFECQAGLRRLLKQCGAIDVLVERTPNFAIPGEFDVHAMLMSLPRIMGTNWDTLPKATPYLQAEPWQLARWQARLAIDPHFKIGVVWSGKPGHEDNPNRLCPIECFAALAAIPEVSVYSLQKGAPAAQFAAQPWADPLKDLGDELNDFADTAAAICALDLVVTVDTSVAHLAGALGKPVWVLLSDAPDWRWLSARDDSPWYPNMRLFRQEKPGEWDAPFARLCAELRQAVVWPRVLAGGLEATALAYSQALLVSLQRARVARRVGKAGQARYELEALLRSVPRHAEANLLLGEVLLEQGQAEAAQAPLLLAQEAWPDHPVLLKSLGMAAQARGDCATATRYLERALNGGNEDAETWQAFGQCCQKLGILPEALRAYRRALDWRPDWNEVADNLGQLLQGMGQWEEAIAHYQRALQIKPDYFPAYFHLGNALFRRGQHAAAQAALRYAVDLEPGHASARNNLGVVLKALGRLEEAESQLREAVRLDPAYSEAYNNLGNALTQQDRLQEAENVFRQALLHDPTNAQAYNNLGIAMQALGAVDTALQCYDTATLLRPNFGQAHWNRALALLLRGDYAAGFEAYEWGFEAGVRLRPACGTPRWQGSAEPGKTLLVHSEQGFGDTLQFVRFLCQAKQRVGRLVLSCQPALVALLSHSLIKADWVDSVIPETAAMPPHDYYCALMSLPHVLKVNGALGTDTPYLYADTRRTERMAQAIGSVQGLKVGLVWAGLPSHQNDRHRSIGIVPFKALLKIPGVHFYSLQKGPAEAALEAAGALITNFAPRLDDFADTAAAIAQLDLVITVDTAVAHLTGAMGKPAWVLLPFAPDWRWGLNQSSSAWYPTVKLFRQVQRGSWESVFDQMQLALTRLACDQRSTSA